MALTAIELNSDEFKSGWGGEAAWETRSTNLELWNHLRIWKRPCLFPVS
jgi:hypothetical protein